MANTVYIEPTQKVQYSIRADSAHQPQNVSPTKQKFNTLKNFLKSKSSLNDLRSKAERKEKDIDNERDKEELINIKPVVASSLRESRSATKLSEFKFKVPKKKRSLGSLISHNQSAKLFDTDPHNNLLGPQTSPPNLVRDTSISTKSSKTSKQSPPKLSFTHDDLTVPQKQLATIQKTPELPFSVDWATPTSIRGTYVHDWSDNMSPRSLTESLRVGRVGNLSPKIQLQEPPEIKVLLNSHITKLDFVSDSEEEKTNNDVRLNLSSITEPSHPLPSPRSLNPEDESKPSILASLRTKSEGASDMSSSSSASVSSNGSEFSFIVNRAASLKFYKSKEQLQKEADIDLVKKERQKAKEFLGTSEDTEFELLEGFSSNTDQIISGFDEDVNYVNYEDDDDTDALFNRDLFGISSSRPAGNLELSDNEDLVAGRLDNEITFNNEYSYKPPATLELSDDEDDFNPPLLSVEISDDKTKNENISSTLIGENKAEIPEFHRTLAAQNTLAKKKTEALDSKRNDKPLHDYDTEEGKDDVPSPYFDAYVLHSEQPNSNKVHEQNINNLNPNGSSESIVKTLERMPSFEDKHQLLNRSSSDLSSKKLLKMLNRNDSGLSFKPQTSEVQIKHTPSAKIQRHRSLKFHQLSADIEENYYSDNYKDDIQWKNSKLLDEVNSIPEDFDFQHEFSIIPHNHRFLENTKKGRLSTMIISNSSSNEIATVSNKVNESHHVWKNLVTGGEQAAPLSERIRLEDKTITLFNRHFSETDKTIDRHDDSYDADANELSTIME